MAPARNESPSQTDTPITDANDDTIPSIPVDAPTVRLVLLSLPWAAGGVSRAGDAQIPPIITDST